jgi:multicomponent Na+:H+ antiporter subunit D
MTLLPALPILSQLLFGAVGIFFIGRPDIQKKLGLASSTLLLLITVYIFFAVRTQGVIVLRVGSWPAPYGITLAADTLAAIMLLMTGIMAFAVSLYSFSAIDERRAAFGHHILTQFLLMGVCGALLTTDLFNLFVWFEVMLLASFVMLVHGSESRQLEGAMKYVTMNLVSSVLFLSALGILYGKIGTLNMPDLALKLDQVEFPGLFLPLAMLFLVSFGIKAAVFPLFFWLPASYHTAPIAVTALFSGLLTKVGVYAMIRVFSLVFASQMAQLQNLLLWIAALTMITGVLGAVAQYDMRRLLSFHIVSQIGYLIMGLALFTPLSLASALYFMAHVILAKSALFLVGGIIYRIRGTYDLRDLGGLYHARPGLSALFIVAALALAGMPPLSGFFAKFGLIRAALEVEAYAISAAALAVSILTLYSMTKIWNEAFWKPKPEADAVAVESADRAAGRFRLMEAPIAVIAIMLVVMGLAAEPLFQVAAHAADQILDPGEYIAAVLGVTP